MKNIVVDKSKCTHCGLCISDCVSGCISFDGENNISNIDTKIEAFNDMIFNKKNK